MSPDLATTSVAPAPPADSVRALRVHDQVKARRGEPSALMIEDAPLPFVGIGDVLLQVKAASFTPTELSWPSTWMDRFGRNRLPSTVGHEVSGIVVEIGYGTTGFELGDAVYGLTDWYRDGAAATLVAAEARNLCRKPTTLDHLHAAVVPMAALTAWQALFDHGRLESEQTVLIHGAAGGVGSFAIQLAHAAGAYVVGTGRHPDEGLLADLGADRIVDVSRQRFEEMLDPVDLVLDFVGGDTPARSWSLLRPGGALVTVVGGVELRPLPSRGGIAFVVEPDRGVLAEIASRIDRGELRPVLGATFDLEDGQKAFEAKLASGVAGKVALRVGS